MIDALNFQDFFKKDKNKVIICFNKQSVTELFGVPEKEASKFLFFWNFIDYNEDFKKYELLKFTARPRFHLDGKDVDVVGAYNVLKKLYTLWTEQFGVAFPDIVIRSVSGSASYAYGEPGQIMLTVEELSDLKRLEFVLSHELGHYFYNQNIQTAAEQDLTKVSYVNKHNHHVWVFLFLLVYNIGVSLFIAFDSETPSFFKVLFLALNSMVVGYLAYFEVASFLSLKKRLKNYTQEFYADHFAQKFLGIQVTDAHSGFVGELYNFNVYTHPRSDWRLKSLEINQQSTYFEWYNPVVKHSQYFLRSSFYETVEYWKLQVKKLKKSFLGYFPNIAKKK